MHLKFIIFILFLIITSKLFAVPVPALPSMSRYGTEALSNLETAIQENTIASINYHSIVKSKKNVRLFCVGERHTSISDKREIISAFSALKAAGYTHFAIEMIPQSLQNLIDTNNYNELEEYFNLYWNKRTDVCRI